MTAPVGLLKIHYWNKNFLYKISVKPLDIIHSHTKICSEMSSTHAVMEIVNKTQWEFPTTVWDYRSILIGTSLTINDFYRSLRKFNGIKIQDFCSIYYYILAFFEICHCVVQHCVCLYCYFPFKKWLYDIIHKHNSLEHN